MNTGDQLPRRIVWIAILFLTAGTGTIGAALDDVLRELAPALMGKAASGPTVRVVFAVVVSISLGALYFRAGFGLLRRQERWRRRASSLAAALSVLLGLSLVLIVGGYLADAQGAAQNAITLDWRGQEVAPQSPRGMLVAAVITAVLGGLTVAFGWAFSVLRGSPTYETFASEENAS
jgi:hypothetical protein